MNSHKFQINFRIKISNKQENTNFTFCWKELCLPLKAPVLSTIYIFLNFLYGLIVCSKYDVLQNLSVDLFEYPETASPEQGLKDKY